MENRLTELENRIEQLTFSYKLLSELISAHLDHLDAVAQYDAILAGNRDHEAEKREERETCRCGHWQATHIYQAQACTDYGCECSEYFTAEPVILTKGS